MLKAKSFVLDSNLSPLERSKQILSDLVSFDTTSHKSNLELIDFVADYLEAFGVSATILTDQTGKKANLVAAIGPQDRPGIVLSGHTDVVPALEEGWRTRPFELVETAGRLVGRGSCDMKGFVACILAMVPEFVEARINRPIWICLSHDEEVGCLGAPAIASWLAKRPVPPFLAIVGEPTEMRLVTGQKGKIAMRCHVHGTSGHSSFAPDHVNAVAYAARIVSLIAARAERFRCEGPFDPDFTVPHSTMLATMIQGGVATNITPERCSFTFEIRSLPVHDARAELAGLMTDVAGTLVPEMQDINPATGVVFEEIFSYPAMGDGTDSMGFLLFRDIMPDWSGKVSYGSEGGVFEQVGGIPSIIVGPGSIAQAHKPGEFIEIEQLDKCLGFLRQMTGRLKQSN
ncbi:acetylornithine deacetylase [Roseibium sp.]|uniref:acetylornithine deacetylase n=1 Tax=Roseibium sp. TaxID=1936156 RepID=UPI003BAE748E